MKNFRTLDAAKNDLRIIAEYIQLIEEYEPSTLLEHAIHVYAREGNLQRTAAKLNQMQFTIDNRSLEAADISALLLSKPSPDDLLHKEIRRLYKKKTYPSTKKHRKNQH